MYNDTVTLFCRHSGQNKNIVWYPTLLRNVHLSMDAAANIAQNGGESADSAVLNIRYHIVDDHKMVGDKVWLPPKEWSGQTDDALVTSITFQPGLDFGFFLAGEWEDTTPVDDAAYRTGFYDYMNKHMDDVYAIARVSRFSVIPHFEVTGR